MVEKLLLMILASRFVAGVIHLSPPQGARVISVSEFAKIDGYRPLYTAKLCSVSSRRC